MWKAVEATIEEDGKVFLKEPLRLSRPCRAIVTILEDPEIETALLSEASLGEDWNRPEEDEAGSHLRLDR
jgi:hypothetical protein